MNKKRVLIILTFMIIFSFVAYYVFFLSSNLKSHMATTKNIEVLFHKIGVIKEYNSRNASAIINYDKTFVYINVPELMGQGAYAEIPITVKNVGILTARLESITEYGFDSSSSIDVKYENLSVLNKPLAPGDETTFNVLIKQNYLTENETLNIKIELNYVQDEGGII